MLVDLLAGSLLRHYLLLFGCSALGRLAARVPGLEVKRNSRRVASWIGLAGGSRRVGSEMGLAAGPWRLNPRWAKVTSP
jgi:hypothetical protein